MFVGGRLERPRRAKRQRVKRQHYATYCTSDLLSATSFGSSLPSAHRSWDIWKPCPMLRVKSELWESRTVQRSGAPSGTDAFKTSSAEGAALSLPRASDTDHGAPLVPSVSGASCCSSSSSRWRQQQVVAVLKPSNLLLPLSFVSLAFFPPSRRLDIDSSHETPSVDPNQRGAASHPRQHPSPVSPFSWKRRSFFLWDQGPGTTGSHRFRPYRALIRRSYFFIACLAIYLRARKRKKPRLS